MNNSREQKLPLRMTFIDFKQAYDTVYRYQIYNTMNKLEPQEKFIRLVKITQNKTRYKILLHQNTYI